jgi:hypothetical protein
MDIRKTPLKVLFFSIVSFAPFTLSIKIFFQDQIKMKRGIPGDTPLHNFNCLEFCWKYRLILYINSESIKGYAYTMVTEFPLCLGKHLRVSQRIGNGNGLDHLVDTHGLCDVKKVTKYHYRKTCTLDLSCHR